MTLIEFSKEVGVGTYYIKQQMKAGEIPYEIRQIGKNFNYYIDPKFVPIFREKLEQKNKSKRKVVRRRRNTRITPLQLAMREVEAYNKINGTNLSYGQAVAKRIIEG